jgi:hypothetical protein
VKLFTKPDFVIYILLVLNKFSHISLCGPNLLANKLKYLGLKERIVFTQTRNLVPQSLKVFCEGLPEYFKELKEKGICEFEEIDKDSWNYSVWLKEITSYY